MGPDGAGGEESGQAEHIWRDGAALCHTHPPATAGLRSESEEQEKRKLVSGVRDDEGLLYEQQPRAGLTT